MITENAMIESVRVTLDRGSFLSLWIQLSGDGWGQGYGGYAFDDWEPSRETRVVRGSQFGQACRDLMTLFKQDRLHDLQGMPCRVRREQPFAKVLEIGHFTKDEWFSFEELWK